MLTEAELRQEAEDHEFNAAFDDVAERFSGEFSPCWKCGAMAIDPVEHCPGIEEG